MRAVILLHRYLGIGMGVVMAMWCLSGFVMMYVGFPQLDDTARLRALEPIEFKQCCEANKVASALGVDVVDEFIIEMVAGRPVLLTNMVVGERHAFDLRTGERIDQIDHDHAMAVASRYALANAIKSDAVYRGELERDQWTVQGQLNFDRPLHRIALGDSAGTELYVSSRTGAIVQNTTARERFWNWIGAVPHWLYPTALRQHAALWAQVVIWLSLAGVFLTVIGIYIGITHLRAMQGGRWSPYRGVNLWHHLSGVFFGVLVLTWVASGLVSMSPWGLFAGAGFKEERDRVRDTWIDGKQVVATLNALANQNFMLGLTRIESAPLHGKLYLLVYRNSQWTRVDAATLQAASLTAAEIEQAAHDLLPDNKQGPVELLTSGDDYYYSGHDVRSLPVYRVIADNADRTRYYLDPRSGDVVAKFDANARWYRWLFEGLHRWDFSPWLRLRPWWDLIVLPLLLGVTVVCCTGVYLGYRRLIPRARKNATPAD